MDLDAFRWLLTDDGQRLLAAATEAGDDSLATQTRLRRTAEPAHVAAGCAKGEAIARRRLAEVPAG